MNTIELAKKANIDCITNTDKFGQVTYMEFSCDLGGLEAFADLVAAHEREACAGLAERRLLIDKNKNRIIGFHHAVKEIAAAILARGTT